MAMHTKTAKLLEDADLVEKVIRAIKDDYGRRYIEQKYNVTRRLIERIKRTTMN